MTEPRYVAVAEVARPHGVRGELRLRVYNPESELLLGRPAIRLVLPDGAARPARIRSARRVPGALLVTLDGVGDRDGAEALRGARVEVPRAALPPPAEGEYYHCDLEGCEARLGGAKLGAVARVVSYPTCDALVIEGPDGAFEVPLTEAFVSRVDLDARVVELSALPEA